MSMVKTADEILAAIKTFEQDSFNTRAVSVESIEAAKLVKPENDKQQSLLTQELPTHVDMTDDEMYAAVLSAGPYFAGRRPTTVYMYIKIMLSFANGLNTRDIANRSGLAYDTIRMHTARMRDALGVNSQLEIVAIAFRKGWIK